MQLTISLSLIFCLEKPDKTDIYSYCLYFRNERFVSFIVLFLSTTNKLTSKFSCYVMHIKSSCYSRLFLRRIKKKNLIADLFVQNIFYTKFHSNLRSHSGGVVTNFHPNFNIILLAFVCDFIYAELKQSKQPILAYYVLHLRQIRPTNVLEFIMLSSYHTLSFI